MIVDGSLILVAAFGVTIAALSVWGLASPLGLMAQVRRASQAPWGMPFAVGVRLLLGAALITAAPGSKFPLVLAGLGWIAVIAAVGLVLLGRVRLRLFVDWFERLSPALLRLWLLLGLVLGAFLIYAAV